MKHPLSRMDGGEEILREVNAFHMKIRAYVGATMQQGRTHGRQMRPPRYHPLPRRPLPHHPLP